MPGPLCTGQVWALLFRKCGKEKAAVISKGPAPLTSRQGSETKYLTGIKVSSDMIHPLLLINEAGFEIIFQNQRIEKLRDVEGQRLCLTQVSYCFPILFRPEEEKKKRGPKEERKHVEI